MVPAPLPIGLFLTSFDPGGTERQMTELIRRLDPVRFAVHVACFHRRGAWLPRVETHARSIAEFPITGFFKPATLSTLATFSRWCRERRIAVLQTCDYYANVFGQPGGALARVPVRIASRRDLNPGRTRHQLALQKAAYRFAHYVVANSSAARDMLLTEGVDARKTLVIPNGVDTQSSAGRTTRPIRTVITVANLRPEKQHDMLLEAAARLLRSGRDLRFQIVGGGPLRTVLEHQAAALGLSDRVTFLGHRDDVPALLGAADLYVLPSRTEACPNGVLEAMAAGLPVVACAVGGLLDLVQHGRTGMLVPPCDAESLATAIAGLVDRPEQAHAIGEAARADIAERYSFDSMVDQFETLYERMARGAADPRPTAQWAHARERL